MPITGQSPVSSGIRDNYRRGTVGDFLKAKIRPDSSLSIVSAYFTIYAYGALKEQLKKIAGLRFLFGEPRFVKSVNPRVTASGATRIIGRTGSSEVNAPYYRSLDQDIRNAVTRLARGEMLISHAIYGQPVKVMFPRPTYRQEQS
jgi:hypothetical protein